MSARHLPFTVAAAGLIWILAACAPALGQEVSWPDLSQPAQAVGGGEADAAVVVGIEGYAFVGPVPGAESNAKLWNRYLADTRGVPPQNVKLLTGVDGTRGEILEAARRASSRVGPEGTLWFVFIGHGAPAKDGKDGLLLGVDAQQKAESLEERGLRRGELLKVLSASRAGAIRVILDACFSGKRPDGSSLAPGLQPLLAVAPANAADPRMAVLSAAKGDQFAGPLPGASRPAFSYLALGGLRGWAAQGRKAAVTAGDLRRYAADALDATLRGRNQTPDLIGKEDALMGVSAGEKGPNLSRLAEATAGASAPDEMFRVSNLPAVPRAEVPKALDSAAAGGLDFRSVDVAALEKYSAAFELDKGESAPEDKAETWRRLAKDAPKFADMAEKRAAAWDRYAAQQKAAEEARQERIEARDRDWEKLGRLLALPVVPAADKERWSGQFAAAYLQSPGLGPEMARDLARHVPAGPEAARLKELAKSAPAAAAPARGRAAAGKAGIEWVRIPGGTFRMGSNEDSDEKPIHQVTVKSFQMAKTEVTNKQYRACVEAGDCTPPSSYAGGDDQPVVNVDWNQAKTFSEWAGGRLPTEAEWEYAARSAGKERKYPWGDEDPTCGRAVMGGCGSGTAPVCSKSAGNTEQGLCDMAGNVWEWTQDWYHASYNGAPSDGNAWESPAGSVRVYRGGSWGGVAGSLRASSRHGLVPGSRYGDLGFRPARGH